MEIRPLSSLWKTSSENWRIDCIPGHYRMWRGPERLVDIRSHTWNMVSHLLRPLSPPWDLIVSVSSVDPSRPASSSQLSVVLPHYDLSFYVDKDGDLQSRNIQGMVYDENQSIGTLFGLVNQLVLRPKTRHVNATEIVPRCVLIPDGDISFQMDGHHVRVEIAINHSGIKGVTYQVYRANTDLGYLTGHASLTSKLYCAYLHALTSGCGADPLTGRRGTEEALSVLRSPSCWSTAKLCARDAELLCLIASICPSPKRYPSRSMQKMEWLNLPANSHSHELFILSKAIAERCKRIQLLYESQSRPLFQKFPLQDDHLLMRSVQRAVYLFPFEFSGNPSKVNPDVHYRARDQVGVATREHCACTAATYIHRRTAKCTGDIWRMVRSWGQTVCRDAAISLQYNRSWLAPHLPSIWIKTYDLLRENNEKKWFQLLFSLPAMVYSSSDLDSLVPVFVAFASYSQFRFEDPPHYDSYPIWEGSHPVSLHKYVLECAYSFKRSPERLEPAQADENTYALEWRQMRMYDDRRGRDADAETEMSLRAWPRETPPPCSLNPDLYDIAKLESKVQRHFSDCFRNLKLEEHLTRVQLILNSLHSQAFQTPNTSGYSFHPSQSIPSCIPWELMADQLFARSAPPLRAHDRLTQRGASVENTSFSDSTALHQLLTTLRTHAANPFQCQYVSALRTSAESFGSEISLAPRRLPKLPTAETVIVHYFGCKARYIEGLHHIQRHLGPRNLSERAIEQSGQWPRITAHALFQCLASKSPIALPDDWKCCLIAFTLLALELQRARRMLVLHVEHLHEDLCMELQNEGCDGWDAEIYPDWLLIQVCFSFHGCINLLTTPRTSLSSATRQFFDSPCSGWNCRGNDIAKLG